MADRTATLVIKVLADAKQASAEMGKVGNESGKIAGAFKKAALPAAAIGAGILAFGKAAGDAASKTQQAMGAVESVFGDSAGTIKKWSDTAADSVGLAKSEYGELASVLGAQLKNMGLPMDQVVGKTGDLIKMGADLAATYGGTTQQAVEALGSALRGETDPIEKYGVSVKQADIAARQAADGTAKMTGQAGKAAKTNALLALVTEQSADAAGQFARESDTAAVAQQKATAKWEDAQSTLGTALLPAMSMMANILATVATSLGKNATLVQVLVGVLGALVVVVLAVNVGMKLYAAGVAVVTAAQWLWNVAVSANPIVLLVIAAVAAVALLVGAIILLWKKSETFRKVVLAVWGAIKSGASAVASFLKRVFSAAFAALSAYVRAYVTVARVAFTAVKAAVNFVTNAVQSLVSWIRGIKVPPAISTAFEKVKDAVGKVIDVVKTLVTKLAGIVVPGGLAGPFDLMKSAIDKAVGAIQSLISWLGRIKIPKLPSLKIPGLGKSAPAPAAAVPGVTSPSARGAVGARATSTSSSGHTFIIQGAVDPESTARQIQRLLDGHSRRVGLRTAGP